MMFTVLATSVMTFAATNLDDLFLLTMFLARRVAARRIVAGQYLGFERLSSSVLPGFGQREPRFPMAGFGYWASCLWASESKHLFSYIIPNLRAPRNAMAH
jgi:hypothetical protein